MKNAFVLEDHFGDDGHVTEGMILKDVATKRFNELEDKGLIREATDAEVKDGFKPTIEADPSKDAGEKKAEEPANKKAQTPANKGA